MSENTHYFVVKADHYEMVKTALEQAYIGAFFDPCENYTWHHASVWEAMPVHKRWVAVMTAVGAESLSRIFKTFAEILDLSGQYWQIRFFWEELRIVVTVAKDARPEISPVNALPILAQLFAIPVEDFQTYLYYQNFAEVLKLFGIPCLEMVDQGILDIPKDQVVDARELS
jgi:hypothetical protein